MKPFLQGLKDELILYVSFELLPFSFNHPNWLLVFLLLLKIKNHTPMQLNFLRSDSCSSLLFLINRSCVYRIQYFLFFIFRGKECTQVFKHSKTLRIGCVSEDNQIMAVIDEQKFLLVISIEKQEILHKQELPKSCNALLFKDDFLVAGDKFGDVWKIDFAKNSTALLLGHVSMITEMVLFKNYIVTADRDEKIRISRFPSAFIIEKYLLGHASFVTCMCHYEKEYLISSDSNGLVCLWNMKDGSMEMQINCSEIINKKRKHEEADGNLNSICVRAMSLNFSKKILAVSLQSSSTVLLFDLDQSKPFLTFKESIECEKSILDIRFTSHTELLVYASESLMTVDISSHQKSHLECTLEADSGYDLTQMRKRLFNEEDEIEENE